MCSRPYYYLVTILLPLFSIFFMSTIFNNGQMVDIPVGVVDLDNSSLSRELIRDFSAVPTFNLKKRYDNAATARDEMVKKDIYAYMVIPYEYSQKVNDGKNVSLCF